MAEYKKEIGAAVVAAVVLAAALGAVAIYSFPGALSSTAAKTSASTSTAVESMTLPVTSSAMQLPVTTSTLEFTTTNGPPASTTTSTANGAWEPGQVVTLVLESSVVQSYIGSAYSYNVGNVAPSPTNPNLLTVTVNVTGKQSVSGNWNTGYEVSYTGLRTLIAEVQFAAPSTYTLQDVAVTVLPSVNQSITYDTDQQQVIQVAFSNDTVKGLMGTAAFYAESVTTVPIQNGTYAGDFFVFMYQVNGTRQIGVFVNGGMTAVLDSYTASRTETMCWTLGTPEGVPAPANEVCFSSPWSGTS